MLLLTVVVVVLLVIAAIGFVLGRQRAISRCSGGDVSSALHSLPNYYGSQRCRHRDAAPGIPACARGVAGGAQPMRASKARWCRADPGADRRVNMVRAVLAFSARSGAWATDSTLRSNSGAMSPEQADSVQHRADRHPVNRLRAKSALRSGPMYRPTSFTWPSIIVQLNAAGQHGCAPLRCMALALAGAAVWPLAGPAGFPRPHRGRTHLSRLC